MKNILFKALLATGILFLSYGCVELDQVDPNRQTVQGFWQNEDQLFQGLMASYDQLQDGTYNETIPIYSIVMSDEATQEWNFELRNAATFNVGDLNTGGPLWGFLYGLIGRAYQVIDRGAEIEGSQVPRMRAEAKFLVALGYYNLVGFFGERVAYVDSEQSATEVPNRADQGQIWALVEELLTDAIIDLPVSVAESNYGRVSRGAAQALLAKVHLMQNEYSDAEPLLKAIIDSDVYSLNENFEDNFIESNTVNPESVFQVNFAHDGIAGEADDGRWFRFHSIVEFAGVFGDIQITNFVRDEFLAEENADGGQDPRMDASIFWSGTERTSYGFTYDQWLEAGSIANPDIAQSLYKYSEQADVINNATPEVLDEADGGTDLIIIRYADILLLYSEVLNELNMAGKYTHVNMVRARSNMSPLPETLDQDTFLEQIKHERLVELVGENVRHFDLIRWGDFNSNKAGDDPNFEGFDSGRDEVWPIPQSELDINPNLLQNPGY